MGKDLLRMRDDPRGVAGGRPEYVGVESARLGSEFGLFRGRLGL